MAINQALVNGTSWSVAVFENGKLGAFHSVPWVFQANNSVSAGSLWVGVWVEIGENKIKVAITGPDIGSDFFEVIFVSSGWFVATKNDNLYRLGKKIATR